MDSKMFKFIVAVAAALAVSQAAIVRRGADHSDHEKLECLSLWDVVQSKPEGFGILTGFISDNADAFEAVLDGDAKLTVFAPTDKAIKKFLKDNGLEASDITTDIVLGHVNVAEAGPAEWALQEEWPTLGESGESDSVEVVCDDEGENCKADGNKLEKLDLNICNGALYSMDGVIFEAPEEEGKEDDKKCPKIAPDCDDDEVFDSKKCKCVKADDPKKCPKIASDCDDGEVFDAKKCECKKVKKCDKSASNCNDGYVFDPKECECVKED